VEDEQVDGATGCRFANRCPHASAECRASAPPLYRTEPNRATACYLYKSAPAIHSNDIAAIMV
jgi:ABC-type dipeptide/oligopeptide/nickel transport system ATPase component